MTREPAPRWCRLEATIGRARVCPERACPFWEPGGAVVEGRCAVDGVDLTGRADLAGLLLRLRDELEEAGEAAERDAVRRRFYRELNEGQGE